MNSLVGYGVSSDSDSDGDADDINNDGTGSSEEVRDEASGVQKSRNFLLEPGSASSESSSDSEAEEEESHPSPPSSSCLTLSSAASLLPAPSLGSSKLPPPSLSASSDSSVFANPFKAQADQRLNVLQKHVPLTMQARPSQIGGKRMCVSYRKDGRCRFGIKCKFAHDSDLQTPGTPTYCQPPEDEETPAPEQDDAGGSQDSQKETKEEESGGQQVKKRKVGLSNSLIPPKRAMKQYAMLQDRERLHMS